MKLSDAETITMFRKFDKERKPGAHRDDNDDCQDHSESLDQAEVTTMIAEILTHYIDVTYVDKPDVKRRLPLISISCFHVKYHCRLQSMKSRSRDIAKELMAQAEKRWSVFVFFTAIMMLYCSLVDDIGDQGTQDGQIQFQYQYFSLLNILYERITDEAELENEKSLS